MFLGVERLAHAKVLAGLIVDDTTGLGTVEAGRGDDEIGHIEGKKTLAIEATGVALRQHKGLGDSSLSIDVTEIWACKKTVIATRT